MMGFDHCMALSFPGPGVGVVLGGEGGVHNVRDVYT